jgi:hypothetical protein
MNFIQKNLASGAALLLLGIVGCSTPQGTREDYFGYNNKPVVEEEKPAAETPKKTWENPLAESPKQTTVVQYEPVFVPVTAPWWDRYYGWEDYHYGHVFVMYPHRRVRYHYGDYVYANYPFYGYPYYGGYPYYDYPRNSYPVYRDAEPVEEKKTTRRIGASRGTVNTDSEKDSRGGDNGWRVRGRGETVPVESSESVSGSSRSRDGITPSRESSSRESEKPSRSSSRDNSGVSSSKKSESRSSSTSSSTSSTSKKSDSGSSSRSSESTKKETKETKSTAKGRGE